MGPSQSITINELDMLGRHDFDNKKNWVENTIPQNLHAIKIHFINMSKINTEDGNILAKEHVPNYPLLAQQQAILEVIHKHIIYASNKLLYMIIQGTVCIGKPHLIKKNTNELNSDED